MIKVMAASAFEMGISASQIPPIVNIYYSREGPELRQTGILYLLGQYIERYTNEETQYRVVKRDNVSRLIRTGQLQSICYMHPKWLGLKPQEVVFSKPFLVVNEQLISRKSIPLIREDRHLRGLNIGLISGYKYPKLQTLIDNDIFKAEYHNNEVNNFISLFRDSEVDAIVFKDLAFRHFVRTMPEIVGKTGITIHPFSLGSVDVSCALSSQAKQYLPMINKAIDEYLKDFPLE
jgi:hypothetical protein